MSIKLEAGQYWVPYAVSRSGNQPYPRAILKIGEVGTVHWKNNPNDPLGKVNKHSTARFLAWIDRQACKLRPNPYDPAKAGTLGQWDGVRYVDDAPTGNRKQRRAQSRVVLPDLSHPVG